MRENASLFKTVEEAIAASDGWQAPILSIRHIIKTVPNGMYAIMAHINCECCVYCNSDGDAATSNLGKNAYLNGPFDEIEGA